MVNSRNVGYFRKDQPKDFSPLTWEKYFSEYRTIELNSNKFRVYVSGTEGPVLVLLHGGGYSGLTWALFTDEIMKKIQCKVLAIDLRGHGETETKDDDDLSIDTMTNDIVGIVDHLYGTSETIIFIGHSMGGALATHCAHKMQTCAGLVVIDVVEGTAMDSLSSMQTFLKNRPACFMSIEHAIQWCYRSSQTHNLDAARVSMPGQIKNTTTGKLASYELSENPNIVPVPDAVIAGELAKQTVSGIATISEEEDEDGGQSCCQNPNLNKNADTSDMAPPKCTYSWRINLSKTEVHWKGWFQGLSELFLNTPAPKLLLLANIGGLDTSLTVGQMQGKFQMVVLPRCGHAIHEDLPERVADMIASYLVRQKLTVAISDFIPVMPGC